MRNGLLTPKIKQRRIKLDTASRSIKAKLAIRTLFAFAELLVMIFRIHPVLFTSLLESHSRLFHGKRKEFLKSFARPQLIIPTATKLPANLHIGFRLAKSLAGFVGRLNMVVNRTNAITLGIHANRQEYIAASLRSRSHKWIDHNVKFSILVCLLHACIGLLSSARKRISRLNPVSANLVRTIA